MVRRRVEGLQGVSVKQVCVYAIVAHVTFIMYVCRGETWQGYSCKRPNNDCGHANQASYNDEKKRGNGISL